MVRRRKAAPGGPAGDDSGAPKKQLLDPEKQQLRALGEALGQRDLKALQELAYAPHGFVSPEMRRAIWLLFLGLTQKEANNDSWKKELDGLNSEEDSEAKNSEARVMEADVQRSVYSWDAHTGLGEATRDRKRVHLSEVMHAILRRHSGRFVYFQGFHDIVLVFLEVGTPTQAFHMVERLALFHLSDQLCCPFEQGLVPLLRVLFHLLTLVDRPVAVALEQAECSEMHFAVPWVLTWFSHSLPRLHQQVLRLFDCLLCSHPAATLYFAAALLTMHRGEILKARREMPDMICTIQGLPLGSVDMDDWTAKARDLMKRVPPNRLLARLPADRRRALPRTTPLLHFPHPWQRPAAMEALPEGGMTQLAPIYSGAPPDEVFDDLGPLARLVEKLTGVDIFQAAAALGSPGSLLRSWQMLMRALGGRVVTMAGRFWAWARGR